MVLTREGAPRPLRALFIGTGSIGRRHIRTVKALEPEARFAFVRDGKRQDALSAEIGAPVYGDIVSAIDWQPDIAVIATPSHRHHEVLEPLLRAGVPTFVEKPVVTDWEHFELFSSLARSELLPATQVGCVLRFLPSVQQIKKWINEGRCGSIVRASFEAGQYLPDWRPDQDYRESYSADGTRGGGVIFDLIHELDLAIYFFEEMQLLHAVAARNSRLAIASEDTALIHLRSATGVLVSVALDYVSRRPVRRIDIVGDEATLRLDMIGKRLEVISAGNIVETYTEGFDVDQAYRAEIAELVIAARTGEATRLPIEEGLRSNRLAIAARDLAGIGQSAEEAV